MTLWPDLFDSLLFSNMQRYACFKVTCLSTPQFFKYERAFMFVDLFKQLLALRF